MGMHLIIVLTATCLIGKTVAQISAANFLLPAVACDGPGAVTFDPTKCPTADKYSICAETATAGTYACACDEPNGFTFLTDKCINTPAIGDTCEVGVSQCPTSSACTDAGDNNGNYRCICEENYGQVTDPTAGDICALRLSKETTPACATCEDNEGICYQGTGDITCDCPSYRTGTDCATSFVNTTCDLTNLQMLVCYTVQPGYDFTTTARMYAATKANEPACKAVLNQAGCATDEYGILFYLDDASLAKCGTVKKRISVLSATYQNSVIISTDVSDPNPVIVNPFCSYQTHSNQQFNPYGYGSPNGNDNGEHKTPTISLELLNGFLNPVEDGVALQPGDEIFFKITCVDDGTYVSCKPMNAMISSDANLNSKNAFVRTLLDDQCPVAGQSILTDINTFKPLNQQQNVWRTGKVTVFTIPTKNSVFLHVKLRVCLSGDAVNCAYVDCATAAAGGDTAGGGTAGGGTDGGTAGGGTDGGTDGGTAGGGTEGGTVGGKRRRRRETTDENAEVSTELLILDPDEGGAVVMSTTGFAIMISLLVVILLVFIVITVLLFLRLRKSQTATDKVGDTVFMTNKPQRFAMPRNDKPQLRL